MSGSDRAFLSSFLSDLANSDLGAPPPSGETPWSHPGKNWWYRWYHGYLCVAQKTGTRRYTARVNGMCTGAVPLELRDAQASAEITARSFAVVYDRQITYPRAAEGSP